MRRKSVARYGPNGATKHHAVRLGDALLRRVVRRANRDRRPFTVLVAAAVEELLALPVRDRRRIVQRHAARPSAGTHIAYTAAAFERIAPCAKAEHTTPSHIVRAALEHYLRRRTRP